MTPGSYGGSGSEYNNTVGLTANWRIFDGGKAKEMYFYNKKIAKEIEFNMSAKKNQIREEVEQSYTKLHAVTQNIYTLFQFLF